MKEKKVKGSLLAIQARFIRANKDKDWDKYLKQEDWDIISGRVLPSVWYPLDTFERCGVAVFELMAGGDLKVIRAMGKESTEMLVKGIYKMLPTESGPARALSELVNFIRLVFNFGEWRLEKLDEKNVKIIFVFGESSPGIELFCNLMMGAFEGMIEMGGGKNCSINFAVREWERDPETIFDIKWT